MDESTVFVGGVDWKANERTLQKFFEQEIGTVLNCKIIVNRDNGHSKGYGFVTFESAELALKAKSAPKLEFMNKQLNVDKAIRRPIPPSGSKTSGRRSGRGRAHHGDRSRASMHTRKPRSSAGSEGTASCASQMSYFSVAPEGEVAGCDSADAGEVAPETQSNDDDKVRQSPTRESSCCSMSTPPHSPVVVAAGASVDVRDSPPSDEGDPACFRNQTPTRPGPAEFHPVPYPQQQQQQQQRPQQPQPLPQPHQQPLPQQHGHLHPAMQAPAFMPMPMPFGQPMPYAAHPPFMPMPQYFLPPNYYYAPYSMQHMHMGHPMHHVPPMQSPYAPYFYVDEECDIDGEHPPVGPHPNRSEQHYHIDELSEQMQSSNI